MLVTSGHRQEELKRFVLCSVTVRTLVSVTERGGTKLTARQSTPEL